MFKSLVYHGSHPISFREVARPWSSFYNVYISPSTWACDGALQIFKTERTNPSALQVSDLFVLRQAFRNFPKPPSYRAWLRVLSTPITPGVFTKLLHCIVLGAIDDLFCLRDVTEVRSSMMTSPGIAVLIFSSCMRFPLSILTPSVNRAKDLFSHDYEDTF